MPSLGSHSRLMLVGVAPMLTLVVMDAIKIMDFAVIDGERTIEEQRKNVEAGVSWTMESKHLFPCRAVDLAPYPINWADTEMFCVKNNFGGTK